MAEINRRLRNEGIFGGKDLSDWFPEYGQCALYCFGEMTDAADIDKLCHALNVILE